MSTSLLYHAFGMIDCKYANTKYRKGKVYFKVMCEQKLIKCPECQSKEVIRAGYVGRSFRMPPIGGKAVFVDLKVPRVCCQRCDKTRQIKLGFADSRYSYSKTFERYALELLRSMTILDVSRHLGVGWGRSKIFRSETSKSGTVISQ